MNIFNAEQINVRDESKIKFTPVYEEIRIRLNTFDSKFDGNKKFKFYNKYPNGFRVGVKSFTCGSLFYNVFPGIKMFVKKFNYETKEIETVSVVNVTPGYFKTCSNLVSSLNSDIHRNVVGNNILPLAPFFIYNGKTKRCTLFCPNYNNDYIISLDIDIIMGNKLGFTSGQCAPDPESIAVVVVGENEPEFSSYPYNTLNMFIKQFSEKCLLTLHPSNMGISLDANQIKYRKISPAMKFVEDYEIHFEDENKRLIPHENNDISLVVAFSNVH
jgi:uncharacterized protein (DUF1499 family)